MGGGGVGDRTAADLERELSVVSNIRDRIRASEGTDICTPTTAVDHVLDELNSLERLPRIRRDLARIVHEVVVSMSNLCRGRWCWGGAVRPGWRPRMKPSCSQFTGARAWGTGRSRRR
ncbi:hypothetical protein CJ177_42620 [Rhodococcus sp. ACPA1]|nr:hypothetical protein CJ177_42620 [Rhodococcus sp. ACPA1]